MLKWHTFKTKFRLGLFILSLSAFAFSLYQVTQYWNYQDVLVDISKQLKKSVSQEAIESEIDAAFIRSDFDDVRMYLEIAKKHNYPLAFSKYEQQLVEQDTQVKRIVNNTSNFIDGFLKGDGSNIAGIAGAVSADFTVVGDVRDLKKETNKYLAGKDVNELIVILSGTGIGLTALTIGSMGTAAPAKTGASMMKLAVKTQRISKGFQKQLLKLGRKIFDWPAFTRLVKQDNNLNNIQRAAKRAYHPDAIQPLKKVAVQVNTIRKSSSAVDTLHLLKYVETTDDLRHLEKVTLKYGSQTKGMMKLFGKGALRTVKVLKRTTELLLSVISSIVSGVISLLLFLLRKVVI
ncbi:hypothetical protein GCM10009133_08220 [Cocleimonas flava]|uniref:Methyl-accepting chemotaxis protein n=1 Tax=Cocleimonas flava TaxID=634765 RepID=A0A4R1EZ43_9GAMM|nr:hypothetical protein [Cocleimonas flava]TCJ87186.1 hypothetical protein EV695_1689 [Cocleimonas flava]